QGCSVERSLGRTQTLGREHALVEKARCRGIWGRRRSCNLREEGGELLKIPLPAVTLVGYQTLQHRDRGLVPARSRNRHLAQERCNVREMRDFSKEAPDLNVGILSRLQAPKKFQDHLFAIDDRGIRLLCAPESRRHPLCGKRRRKRP